MMCASKFLIVVVALISIVGVSSDRSAPLPKIKHKIAVIAHRGGKALAPENTLAAFRKAIELGCDYVEIDVRETKDKQFVIMHDRTVDRTTDGVGAVSELDLAAIRKLDAGKKFSPQFAGEKVPTLDETLALCKDRINIYLDHKDGPVADVLSVVRKHGMEKQVIVYGGVDTLKEWKRLAPHIPVMPTPPTEFRRKGGLADFKRVFFPEILDGNVLAWTKELVDEAHANGMKVYVDNLGPWDNPDGFRKAIEIGVDGIQTDYPDKLLGVLQEIDKKRTHRLSDPQSTAGMLP